MAQGLTSGVAWVPGQPLWRRVPTQDAAGKPLSDFMMLIPRFNRWPEARQQVVCQQLQQLLGRFDEQVVFVELNVELNLLWVSLRPGKGLCAQLSASVRQLIPEAVLVASQAEALAGQAVAKRRPQGIRRLLAWLGPSD